MHRINGRRNIRELPRIYLKWAGFSIKQQKARYLKRNWADAIAATVYSLVSIILIWIQQADLIVFGLNILCLFRAMINNTICASKVTNRIREKADIEEKREMHSHYHLKAGILIVSLLFAVITWVVFFYEKNNSTLIIRFFVTLYILTVFFNDCENIIICAYDASIESVEC